MLPISHTSQVLAYQKDLVQRKHHKLIQENP